ncbi:MAG: NAD(P)-binding protein, partial [Acidobacteriota bacterium]
MNGHAVVIGGGIGGMLAAHALAGHFEHVTVLERDSYPPQLNTSASPPASRKGAPQSRCLHMLMASGGTAFDHLVPGWRQELVARGAVRFDVSADAAMRFPTGWLPRAPSGITTYACSRALLEGVLRYELARKPTVWVQERQRVVGLTFDRLGERVTGVRVSEVPDPTVRDITAEL